MRLAKLIGAAFLLVSPLTFASTQKVLTLHDAILLAMRFNPKIHTAELQRVVQKFTLEFAKYTYYDFKWSDLTIERAHNRIKTIGSPVTTSNSWQVKTSGSWTSPIGTKVTVSPGGNTFGWANQWNPSLAVGITQPLLKGFGVAINEIDLEDAFDTEETNKLNLKNSISSTIDTVISNYIAVINAKQQIEVENENLKRDRSTLKQTLAQIKAGSQPASDATQYKSDIASDLSTLQSDKTALDIARYNLLDSLGLKPTASIDVTDKLPLDMYKTPTLEQAEKIALQNNIGYQTSVIGLRSTQRSLMKAKDDMRWGLDFGETYTMGGAKGLNGLYHSVRDQSNYESDTSLTLTIPLDQMSQEQTLLNDTIGLETAEINLRESKRNLYIQTISALNTIKSQKTQITLNKQAVTLAKKAYENSLRQYQAGSLSSISVSNAQQSLTTAERGLINSRISYFNSLVSLDNLLGHTTETWGIHLHY